MCMTHSYCSYKIQGVSLSPSHLSLTKCNWFCTSNDLSCHISESTIMMSSFSKVRLTFLLLSTWTSCAQGLASAVIDPPIPSSMSKASISLTTTVTTSPTSSLDGAAWLATSPANRWTSITMDYHLDQYSSAQGAPNLHAVSIELPTSGLIWEASLTDQIMMCLTTNRVNWISLDIVHISIICKPATILWFTTPDPLQW